MPAKLVSNGFEECNERHLDKHHPYDGSGFAARTCTDVHCLAVFVLYVVGMGCVMAYAFQSGDPRRLTHGFNFKGQLCGVDEGVEDKPLTYLCGTGTVQDDGIPVSLDLHFPICVNECPKDMTTEMACFGVEQVRLDRGGSKPLEVNEKITVTQSTAKQMSYPTMELDGTHCIPHLSDWSLPGDEDLTRSLMGFSGIFCNPWAKFIADMGGYHRCWPLIVGLMLVALGFGYLYLFLLKYHPKLLVKGVLLSLAIGLLFMAVFFLAGDVLSGNALEKWESWTPLFREYDRGTARVASRLAGLASGGLGAAVMAGALSAEDSVGVATGCIEVACECMFAMPSLLLVPLAEAVWKLCAALSLLCGLTWLLSTMEMKSDYIKVNAMVVGGLTRSPEFSNESKCLVAYYLFGMFWLLELGNTVSQFVISYAVLLWYYTPKPKGSGPHVALVRGLVVGVAFHLGTLALGALLTPGCRLLRFALAHLAKHTKSRGNIVCKVIARCVEYCTTFFKTYLEFIDANAYIDVCICSTSLCAAAKNSSEFLAIQGGDVCALTAACYICCIVGALAVSATVGELAYLFVATSEQWSSEVSPQHVASPYFIAAVAAILAGSVALGIITVLDHCANTLLYAYAWNKSHGHNTVQRFAPDALVRLTEYRPIAVPGQHAAGAAGLGPFSAFRLFSGSPAKSVPEGKDQVRSPRSLSRSVTAPLSALTGSSRSS